jgi:transcription elongation factor Elf1
MLEIESGELYSCPYCKSDNIDGSELDFESWTREVTCKACGRTWEERAKVYEIAIPDEYEDIYRAMHPTTVSVVIPQRIFNPQPKPEKGKKK